VRGIACDVTSDEAVKRLFNVTGVVDHVVVTAAILKPEHIKKTPIEHAKETMESKFWGAWRVAQFCGDRMRWLSDVGNRLSEH
jgi:NAD(P)-dependent dehydrogenase (short-subunit alcohol dehydrogenase family)